MISGQDAFILEACFAGTVFHTLNMPFSKSNELAVVEYLINFCEKQLKQLDAVKSVATDRQLSTTVVSDNDGDLMKEVQLAKLRLQERKAIEVTLNMLKTDLSSLQGPMDYREYYQERRLKELDLLRPLVSCASLHCFCHC